MRQRHWHAAEDEFVYVIAGEVVLVTDQGEELLHAGGGLCCQHAQHTLFDQAERGAGRVS
jgi:uncharacterized cupin superfamily protein